MLHILQSRMNRVFPKAETLALISPLAPHPPPTPSSILSVNLFSIVTTWVLTPTVHHLDYCSTHPCCPPLHCTHSSQSNLCEAYWIMSFPSLCPLSKTHVLNMALVMNCLLALLHALSLPQLLVES